MDVQGALRLFEAFLEALHGGGPLKRAWSGISKRLSTSLSSWSRIVPRREVSSSRKASTTWILHRHSLKGPLKPPVLLGKRLVSD